MAGEWAARRGWPPCRPAPRRPRTQPSTPGPPPPTGAPPAAACPGRGARASAPLRGTPVRFRDTLATKFSRCSRWINEPSFTGVAGPRTRDGRGCVALWALLGRGSFTGEPAPYAARGGRAGRGPARATARAGDQGAAAARRRSLGKARRRNPPHGQKAPRGHCGVHPMAVRWTAGQAPPRTGAPAWAPMRGHSRWDFRNQFKGIPRPTFRRG